MRLRRARADDARLLWEWANDPAARAASFSGGTIGWEEHERWLAARLDGPNALILIAEDEDGPLGTARFALEAHPGGDAVMSASVDAARRGRGLGTALIAAAARRCFAETAAKRILAWIKPDNHNSLVAFARAGFRSCGRSYWNGHPAELYALDRGERDE